MTRRPVRTLLAIAVMVCCAGSRGPAQGAGERIDCTSALSLNQGTTGQFAQIFVPDYFRPAADGAFTLIVHLHSASSAAEDEVTRAHANAILCNIHCGALSSPYQSYFSRPGVFRRILDTVSAMLRNRNIIAAPSIRHLLLTSFSAGYAGVREILRSPESYGMIDALLLADGLHSSLDSALMKSQMQDFLRFALDARDGRKIFLLTHSSIPTAGYRSTTETAEYLLRGLNCLRRPVSATDEIGAELSVADTGQFHLRGYSDDTATDHMKHLYAMHRMVTDALAILEGVPTGLREEGSERLEWSLRVFPNPFNATTMIRVHLPWACRLKVVVFDIAGAEVSTLWDGVRETGDQLLRWDAGNVASGMYVVRASAEPVVASVASPPGRFRTSEKILLLR